MGHLTTTEKYSQPQVVSCWQTLSRHGLQKAEQEMVTRWLPGTGTLLDIGCGAGRAVLALSRDGRRVVGIDLSLPMLSAGRALSAQANLGGANVLALPFADGTFKGLFMFFGALQHLPGRENRRRALAEMARITDARGRLVMGLDNLAPGLFCYCYWLTEKIGVVDTPQAAPDQTPTTADTILWSRESRRVHPLLWHARGLVRTLRWRTWPGLLDRIGWLRSSRGERGDRQVAQFSLRATPGTTYYHLYQRDELVADATAAGWRLRGHHSGTELAENRIYPAPVRNQDKQQFFAFEKI
jgi:ubiquinone/menaquinone biosynthesis C-methylase UbiE